jgi:hypothetical protein
MIGIFDSNQTTANDVSIFVIGDGYESKCGDQMKTFAYVNDAYELQVVTDDKRSSTRVFKGSPHHYNGTVGIISITITPVNKTTAILIRNPQTNGTNVLLQVSFDGGTNYFDIERRGQLEIEAEVDSFQIKATVANSDYQIITTEYDP